MKIFLSLFSIFFFIFKCLDPKANGTGNLGKTWGKPEGNLISKQPWPGGKFRRSFLLTMCGLPVDINQNVGGWVFLLKATAAIATTTIWECSWNFQFRLGAVNLLNCCVLALGIISPGQDFPTGESAIKLPTYQSIQDEHKRMMDLPTPNSHFPCHSTSQILICWLAILTMNAGQALPFPSCGRGLRFSLFTPPRVGKSNPP